jgi:HAD superfamily hydrolase (TIGR01549 family)
MRFIDRFEVILLDMGRTFMFEVDRFNEDDDFGATYRKAGGNRLKGGEVFQILSAIFDQMIADSKRPEKYDKFCSVSAYLKKHAKSAQLPAEELAILEEVFSEHEAGTIPQVYVSVLRQLRKTHRLGIVSDIWSHSERFRQELDRAGIKELFEAIVFSSDIGIVKPSPKIFQKALDTFGVDVARVVYIGDSLRRDVAGAKSLGMAAIWIQRDQISEGSWRAGSQRDISVKPDLTISDLQDVLLA